MSAPTSIAEFFGNGTSGDGVYDRIADDERNEISIGFKDTPDLGPGLIKEELNEAMREILDVSFADIFCGGWAKLQELQDYLDPEKHPSGEVSLVPLVKHKIGSKHTPLLQLYLDDKLVAEIKIEIDLVLKLEGFRLRIKSGRITDILSGTYQGTGKISCRGGVLAEKTSEKHELSGEWPIEGGFPIPRI